ncbi:NADH-quinone oxidoreductase subunit L [bacterium]|nr:NADH-quinone oxidoreductase subunit L [bacterium]
MTNIFWLIPLFPGLAALLNGLAGPGYIKRYCGHLAAAALAGSFLLSLMVFLQAISAGEAFTPISHDYYTWIGAGTFTIPFGVYVDQLALVMMLVVSFVGTVIFVYAIGYMKDDPGYPRFFTYMPLFAFFMLLLVMGNSLPLLFVGWEGVGLCSYLLIGYYYDRDYAADAGQKAFIVNRIGDFGFLIGMLLLFIYADTLSFNTLFEKVPFVFAYGGIPVTMITLLFFIGATGKSAQIPLYVWLPDAMAGPTPVSALIHAATMVTAGVYMVARLNLLFTLAPITLMIIGILGGLTALGAASIALVQRDAKKILAYSTISQLGYMFIACGAGAYIAGVFHLMTHAFFKACLFLGAGSVLHAFHRTTDVDVFEAGGLRKWMPFTRITFLVATLAIAGIPPLAGFFSKDEILWEAFSQGHLLLWMMGIAAAFCTAFYMFRLYNLLFSGSFRGTEEQRRHIHESSSTLWLPLVVLAAFSICIGWLNMPLIGYHGFHDFLHPVFEQGHHIAEEHVHHAPLAHEHWWEWGLAAFSIAVALAGILFARLIYVWFPTLPARIGQAFSAPYIVLWNKYRVDEMYEDAVVKPYISGCRLIEWFDDTIIIHGLNRMAHGIGYLADRLRRMQTGLTPHYAVAMLAGAVFLTIWLLVWY